MENNCIFNIPRWNNYNNNGQPRLHYENCEVHFYHSSTLPGTQGANRGHSFNTFAVVPASKETSQENCQTSQEFDNETFKRSHWEPQYQLCPCWVILCQHTIHQEFTSLWAAMRINLALTAILVFLLLLLQGAQDASANNHYPCVCPDCDICNVNPTCCPYAIYAKCAGCQETCTYRCIKCVIFHFSHDYCNCFIPCLRGVRRITCQACLRNGPSCRPCIPVCSTRAPYTTK